MLQETPPNIKNEIPLGCNKDPYGKNPISYIPGQFFNVFYPPNKENNQPKVN